MSELDPPASHARMTVVRVWPVLSHWRYDVQHPGPPKMRASGESATEADALASAVDELDRLAAEVADG